MRLIDAERLCESIEKTLRWAEENNHKEIYNCICDIFIPTVVAQPTVEAEPIRHAKWLPIYYDNQPMICACSLCDRRVINKYELPRYCPTCGAKMDEEAEE